MIGFLSFAVTVSFGAYLCLHGEITLGTIVGYTQLLNYIIWPFTQAMELLSDIQTGLVSTKRVLEVMRRKEEDKGEEVQLTENSKLKAAPELILENVSFAYEGKKELILNLNIKLEAGQFIGIGGRSGQGKSTLLKLILSIYQPTQGEIKLVTNNIQYQGAKIRDWISYVPQEHMLFTGSIKDNILLGDDTATMEEMEEAAKKADIHDFIISLENGYETILDEKGSNISFGQAQRIAIARALLKNSPVIMLDEPTASLDKASEEAVMSILRREAKDRLCLVVSHSMTDEKEYDKMIWFRDGMVEIQSYELIQMVSSYQKLNFCLLYGTKICCLIVENISK